MQKNKKISNVITDLELARIFGTDRIDVELKEFDVKLNIKNIGIRLSGIFCFHIDGIEISAHARELVFAIATIGLLTLILKLIQK